MSMISPDPRLRAFTVLILFGLIGHFCQLISEDKFWNAEYRADMWISPGWHLELHPVIPLVAAAGLLIAVLCGICFRSRAWLGAIGFLYICHFFTYPFRIRNHMTFMLTSLAFLSVSLLATDTIRSQGSELKNPRIARIDNQICIGLALILVINYFFAGFHKLNTAFLALDSALSPGADTIEMFLSTGKISSYAPYWLLAILLYGTLLCEMIVPTLMWRVSAVREFLILVMLVFHFPMVSTMAASDYPMIAVAFYPTLFAERDWSIVEHRLLNRWNWMNFAGALAVIAAHIRFTFLWTPNTVYGILVAGLWGFAAVGLARCASDKVRQLSILRRHPAL
jgi:hypothetical protein